MEMPRSSTSGFNNDRQRQRPRVCVYLEFCVLPYTIVGNQEVVGREFEDHSSRFVLYEYRYLDECGVYRQSGLMRVGFALLRP